MISLGLDYTCACHTCRVYTPYEKYTPEYAKSFYEAFKEKHKGHNTILTTDYDEEFYLIAEGWNEVKYIGYGRYKTSDKEEPYQFVSDLEVEELAHEAMKLFDKQEKGASNDRQNPNI